MKNGEGIQILVEVYVLVFRFGLRPRPCWLFPSFLSAAHTLFNVLSVSLVVDVEVDDGCCCGGSVGRSPMQSVSW